MVRGRRRVRGSRTRGVSSGARLLRSFSLLLYSSSSQVHTFYRVDDPARMPPDVGLAVEVFSEAAPPPRTSGASKYDGPGCGLYGQFADICDWLKSARSRNARQGKVNGIATRETLAHRVNENLNKLKQIFARDWATLGADKQQIAVDLVVAAYCRSRGKPDDMCEEVPSSSSSGRPPSPATLTELAQIRCKLLVVAIDTAWKAHVAPTSESRSKDVVRFFEDLQRLYRAPLTPDELCKVHTLRGQSQPRQPVLMSIGANLGAVNARRKVRLEQVSDALAQLDQLTPIHSQRHRLRPAVELHFALFSLEQQISLVQSVRAFLFAACEQRARKGTLPDPTDLVRSLALPWLSYARQDAHAAPARSPGSTTTSAKRSTRRGLLQAGDASTPASAPCRPSYSFTRTTAQETASSHAFANCWHRRSRSAGRSSSSRSRSTSRRSSKLTAGTSCVTCAPTGCSTSSWSTRRTWCVSSSLAPPPDFAASKADGGLT